MTPNNEWLFYTRASWNIGQAVVIAQTILKESKKECSHNEKVIQSAAYNFCLVSYYSPFMDFHEPIGKHKGLRWEKYVPEHLIKIHNQIGDYRCKILAHTDISHLSAPNFEQGNRVMYSEIYLAAPPIDKALGLFCSVAERVALKLASLSG